MAIHTNKPVIGISLDSEGPGGYSPMPWYALRENYADVVRKWGGVPVMLPHEPDLVEEYLRLVDGVVFTGGNFDIDPTLYGEKERHETVITKHKRTLFEMRMAKQSFQANVPMLGICGGEQLINVILGGTLFQHVPDAFPEGLEHEQKHSRLEMGHYVTVKEGTLLHRIVKEKELAVNTSHHQAVDKVAPGMIVNAIAPDGVIEGIEHTVHPFCLGVQWHPEYEVCEGDSCIFQSLIQESSRYMSTKSGR